MKDKSHSMWEHKLLYFSTSGVVKMFFLCADEEGWAHIGLLRFHVFSLSWAVPWVYKGEIVSLSLLRCQAQLWAVGVVLVFKMILALRLASPGINLCEYSIIMTANVREDRTITHRGPVSISVAVILILNCLSPLCCSAITCSQNTTPPTPIHTFTHPLTQNPPTSCTFHKKETL